jgi:Rne/Rng family ribonuclease
MIVIDVNTGKFIGKGGNLEETVTKNNLEAAEEIARQLRLRDMGGIIVIDFIDMTLESNRELVLRRLVECLGRDRTKHQVAEVTSLGLVQMTRKRVGQGLIEAFSTTCESCGGRGIHIHSDPVKKVAFEDDLDDKSETSIDAESISTDEEVEQTPPAPAARRKGRRAVSTGVISTN